MVSKAKTSPAGLYYEVLVSNWLASEGYKVKIRQKSRRIGRAGRVGEADIIARKKKGLFGEEVLFVECKDKKIVTLKDFQRFVTKFSKFLDREPEASGLLVYSGELEPDVKDYYYSTLDPDLQERIKLRKKTRKQLQRFTKLYA
jgi:Holliday junction resolvase-like predicted endonuclease